jgi:cytochrome c oxidase subunit 2
VRRTRTPRRIVAGAALVGFAVVTLAGCGNGDQSALDPVSPPARTIAGLWWWMLGGACVIFAGAVGMLVVAWLTRRSRGFPMFGENETLAMSLVLAFGIAIPLVTLTVLFAVSNIVLISRTDAPSPSSTAMTIEVIGHQWFWEVRYPGTDAVTANEIHIPVGTRVNLELRTADVIHSFWVPRLNRKSDLIPGKTNRILLLADKPGVYRGQCAEFCGLQHAHMSFYVFADRPARFRAWLASEAAPRRAPATPAEKRGEQVFLSQASARCHTIRGTSASSDVGPDLTHVASRTTLAALTIPNSRTELTAWVADPQHVKPGNLMPAVPLGGEQLSDVVTYLESLK